MDIAIYTLGCKVNQVETQAMERELLGRGYRLVEFDGPAEYSVRTCNASGGRTTLSPYSAPVRKGGG